jgi:cation:H+ antiporter
MAVLALVSRYVIKFVEDLIEITGLSETSAGFALLSVITSTPELVIAVFAVISGTPQLSVGDLLGSNVFNIGIVVGVLMVATGFLKECPEGLHEVADILLLSSVIPLLLVIFGTPTAMVGFGLLAVFVFSVYRETKASGLGPTQVHDDSAEGSSLSRSWTLFKVFLGTIVVVIAARFTVSSALEVSAALGIDEILVGALVVAFGTSLPELSLSLVAVRKGRIRLAMANAIGSNLTNLTLILGVVFASALVFPFSVAIEEFLEIISFVLITSIIVWHYMIRGGDCRRTGVALILTYVAFQILVALR